MALRATVQTGRPSVLVVTSGSDARSQRLRRELLDNPQVRALSKTLSFTEMAAESHAAQVKGLGIRAYPTVLVYRRGAKGLECMGAMTQPENASYLLGWLSGLGLGLGQVSGAPAPVDPGVSRTQYATGQAGPSGQGPPMPSGQHYPPPQPPPTPPPVVQQPYIPPSPPPTYQVAPVVTGPAPVPTLIAPAAPTYVVQQQPATIMMAPAPAPTVVQLQPAQAPPMASAPPMGNAPPQNLFTQPAQAPPTGAAPPANAPSYAPPTYPQQVAYAPPTQPVASAPQQVGQGPIAAAVLTTVLTNPSLWERILGTIGEHLAQKKNPRIQMGQAPVMQAPMTGQAPPAGQAPVAYAPAAGQAYVAAAPAVPYAYGIPTYPPPGYAAPPGYVPQPPPYPQPEYPVPSPQGYAPSPTPQAYPAPTPPPKKHGLFHHWGHRD
jgi:hypothetical protein